MKLLASAKFPNITVLLPKEILNLAGTIIQSDVGSEGFHFHIARGRPFLVKLSKYTFPQKVGNY